jgi:hypothetical protein
VCGGQTIGSRGRHSSHAARGNRSRGRRPRRARRVAGGAGAEDARPLRQGSRRLLALEGARSAEGRRGLRARPGRERAEPVEPRGLDRAPRAAWKRRDLSSLRDDPGGLPGAPPLPHRDPRRARAARPSAGAARRRRLLARRTTRGRAGGGHVADRPEARRRDERLPEHAEPEARRGRQLQPSPPLDPAAPRGRRPRLAGRGPRAAPAPGALALPGAERPHLDRPFPRFVPCRPLLGAPVGARGAPPAVGAARPRDRVRSPAGSVGSPTCCQASKPPSTSVASRKPSSWSRAAARLEE